MGSRRSYVLIAFAVVAVFTAGPVRASSEYDVWALTWSWLPNNILRFDADTGLKLGAVRNELSPTTPFRSMAVAPDGNVIASAHSTGSLELFAPWTGAATGETIDVHRRDLGRVSYAMEYSGEYLYAASQWEGFLCRHRLDGSPAGSDPENPDRTRFSESLGQFPVNFRQIAPGGDGVIYVTYRSRSGSGKNRIGMIDASTGEYLGDLPQGGPEFITNGLEFGPDGLLYVTGESEIARYDVITGQWLDPWLVEAGAGFSDLQFAPDGRVWLSRGIHGSTVQAVDFRTRQPAGPSFETAETVYHILAVRTSADPVPEPLTVVGLVGATGAIGTYLRRRVAG